MYLNISHHNIFRAVLSININYDKTETIIIYWANDVNLFYETT